MMKQYVKQKVKHKMKLYSTRVSVRQMKEQHSETKRSTKRRKKVVTQCVCVMGLMTSCYRVDVPNGPMGQSIVKSLVKVGKGVICGTSYGIASRGGGYKGIWIWESHTKNGLQLEGRTKDSIV